MAAATTLMYPTTVLANGVATAATFILLNCCPCFTSVKDALDETKSWVYVAPPDRGCGLRRQDCVETCGIGKTELFKSVVMAAPICFDAASQGCIRGPICCSYGWKSPNTQLKIALTANTLSDCVCVPLMCVAVPVLKCATLPQVGG